MGKVKINRDDKARILLTELLPYEVPMLFSNEGFYSIVTNKEYDRFFKKVIELSRASNNGNTYGIPFNYEIGKSGTGDTRTLSVMHPYNQYEFISLYEEYDSLMLHLCSKSPFSLRKISKVAKFYYSPDFLFNEDPHRNAGVETEHDTDPEPELISFETRYIKSYFTYKPVDLIYKFYERNEYQRLEQRFRYKMEFDISKCFYNIYTHSVCWAVKDKETAKRNARQKSFENSFDKVMQLCNYNETNGILVGPEVSRIFAEIILQQIDLNALARLQKEYKLGVDFEVRRYVDDYFVFSNSEDILQAIKKIYQEELEYYKLYLNSSKEDTVESPFITDVTVGKRELKGLLNSLFDEMILPLEQEENGKDKKLNKIRKPYSFSQNFIRDFQCIVKKNRLSYSLLSKDVIRSFKSKLVKILKDDKIQIDKEAFENFLMVLFDVSFYSYSLNINSNTYF
ncbi:MAG: RNA-directed DNA polymerase [Crocinitomicaceae bacterium]|nr:RNA-directed DNA polymerase [Crocinitomicaceae bacterium]